MKIRNCFVSNSSSSSFVVQTKKRSQIFPDDERFIISKKHINKLKQYGFTECNSLNPFNLNEDRNYSNKPLSLKYSITCNQDNVIYFLVKNNIPFKSSIHYGHQYWEYKKDSDYILKAKNYGLEIEMYGEPFATEFIQDLTPIEKIPVKKWLKENDPKQLEKDLW